MFAGRIRHYAKLQVRCGYDAASWSFYSDLIGVKNVAFHLKVNGLYSSAAGTTSKFQLNLDAVGQANDDYIGGGGWSAGYPTITYTAKWGSVSHTHTESALPTTAWHYIEFVNFEIWVTSAQEFLTKWDAVNWYKSDGTLLLALAGAGSSANGLGELLPSGVPIFNGTLDVTGSCLAGVTSTNYGRVKFADGAYYDVNATFNALCGWRASVDGTNWITPPVSWADSAIGGTGTTWLPDVTVHSRRATTYGVFGTSSHRTDSSGHPYYLCGVRSATTETNTFYFTMLPSYPRSTTRLAPDAEAPVVFYGQDTAQLATQMYDGGDPYWQYTNLLGPLGTSYHLVRDNAVTPETTLMGGTLPGSHTYNWFKETLTGGGATIWVPPNSDGSPPSSWSLDTVDTGSIAIPSTDPDYGGAGTTADTTHYTFSPHFPNPPATLPYLQDLYVPFQLYNGWHHAHWSAFYAVQSMELEGSVQLWVNGDGTAGYFNDVRQTYDDSIIPSGERTQHRAEHVVPPFQERALGALMDTVSGFTGSYWWGSNGSVWLVPNPVPSVTLGASSAPRWSFLNGTTPVTGGSVTDTAITIPAGANVAQFDLSRWDVYPFGYCAIVQMVQIAGSLTNCTSWRLDLVSETGQTAKVATSAGTYRLPSGTDNHWSISAAMQFGDSSIITDTYVSVASSDDSGTVYGGDPWLLATTGKIYTRQGTKLRLTVVPTDTTQPVTFAPLVLNAAPIGDMKVFELNARDQVLLIANGPSLMMGPLQFFDPITATVLDTPLVNTDIGPGQASAGDYMALYLSVFQAQQPTVHLHDLAASLFVYGTSGTIEWSQLKHFWQDPFNQEQLTTGYALGPSLVFVLNNTYRNIPPMALCPEPLRSPSNWSGSGLGQYGYMTGSTRRYIVSRPSVALIAPTGAPDGTGGHNVLTTSSTDAVNGWNVQYFRGRVSNIESENYLVQVRGAEYARVRPWRGWVFAGYVGPPISGSQSWIVQDKHGRYHRGTVMNGDVQFYRSDCSRPTWVYTGQATSYGDAMQCCFELDPTTHRYDLYVVRSGRTVSWLYSDDDGQTWADQGVIVSNAGPFYTASGPFGEKMRVWFVYDSGTSGPGSAMGQFRDVGDTAWSSAFTFVDTSGTPLVIADGGMSNVAFAISAQGELTFAPQIDGDTGPSDWRSDDNGRTWRRLS